MKHNIRKGCYRKKRRQNLTESVCSEMSDSDTLSVQR